MKKVLTRAATIMLIGALLLAFLCPGVFVFGGETVNDRGDVSDWTILGLDVPRYTNGTQVKVPLDERRWIHHHKMEVRWKNVQPQAGRFVWDDYDSLINAVLSDGSQSILLVLGGPLPEWARDASFGRFADKAPPRDLNDWYGFCAAVAERYGSVVDFYEIWNEPGWDRDGEAFRLFGTYHFGGQVETDYLPLLQLGYTAIKDKDPSGIVMCGSLLDTLVDDPNVGTGLYTYLLDDASRPRQETALSVKAESAIAAERRLDLSCVKKGILQKGLMGIYAEHTEWYFADGCTRPGFDMWLSLQNREVEDALVTVDYYRGDGSRESRGITIPARSRLSLPVFEKGLGAGRYDSELGDISISLISDKPILAERSIYSNRGSMMNGQADETESASPRTEWSFEYSGGQYSVQDNICLLNPGPKAVAVTLEPFRPGETGESRSVEVAAQSRTMVPVVSGGPQASAADDLSIRIYCTEPIVVERSPRFSCSGTCSGEYTSPGITEPLGQWDFAGDYNKVSIRDSVSLQNPGTEMVRTNLNFRMAKGETLDKEILLQPEAGIEMQASDLLGFGEYCDMVAVHPYRSPGNWGAFYKNLAQALRSIGVYKEIAVTEIGWLHYKDDQPQEFDEQEQADAMGSWGIGPLREAGCRKIWVYKDMDEKPGTSWDKCYFGLFGYDGDPHASWHEYKEWQSKNPEYPLLPSSLP
jgi:hypothetical protein